MLKVKTYISDSKIHGKGVFAAEDIKKGTVTWVFEEQYDITVTKKDFNNASPKLKKYLNFYAYENINGDRILCGDNAKFENHSESPNQMHDKEKDIDIARKDIKKDEELTINYYEFDAETQNNNSPIIKRN